MAKRFYWYSRDQWKHIENMKNSGCCFESNGKTFPIRLPQPKEGKLYTMVTESEDDTIVKPDANFNDFVLVLTEEISERKT